MPNTKYEIRDANHEHVKAYDKAAKKYHGEFAVLNFPDANPRHFEFNQPSAKPKDLP